MEEMITGELLRLLPNLLGIALHLAMLAVVVYCIAKQPTPPAYVMLVAMVLEIPGTILSAWFNIWGVNLNLPLEEISRYFGILGTISNIGAMMFACGFLLFIHGALRKRVSV